MIEYTLKIWKKSLLMDHQFRSVSVSTLLIYFQHSVCGCCKSTLTEDANIWSNN